MSGRRAFGSIRKARSGRFEVRYTGPDGGKYTAGRSFIRKTDASAFLAHVEAEISEGTWVSPKESRERKESEGGPEGPLGEAVGVVEASHRETECEGGGK